mmetsp:Transcript_1516/g.5191  ORF Transcript_1516/g.5191 Transcript_1516/m.5191 type:complete len:120 (-) Transcript_1516:2173-2532(-)
MSGLLWSSMLSCERIKKNTCPKVVVHISEFINIQRALQSLCIFLSKSLALKLFLLNSLTEMWYCQILLHSQQSPCWRMHNKSMLPLEYSYNTTAGCSRSWATILLHLHSFLPLSTFPTP